MRTLELFRNEEGRKSYKMSSPALEYCEAVFSVKKYHIAKIILTRAEGVMYPNEKEEISSFDEIVAFTQSSHVVSCLFLGEYDSTETDILVNFALKRLFIITTKETVYDLLKKDLEG